MLNPYSSNPIPQAACQAIVSMRIAAEEGKHSVPIPTNPGVAEYRAKEIEHTVGKYLRNFSSCDGSTCLLNFQTRAERRIQQAE